MLPALVKLCTSSLAMSIVSACRQGGAGQAAATVPSEFGSHWFLSWLHRGGTTRRAVRHRIIAAFLFPKGGDPICKEGLGGAPGRRSPHLSCSSSLRRPRYIDLPVTGWSFSQRRRPAIGGYCTSKQGVDCCRRLRPLQGRDEPPGPLTPGARPSALAVDGPVRPGSVNTPLIGVPGVPGELICGRTWSTFSQNRLLLVFARSPTLFFPGSAAAQLASQPNSASVASFSGDRWRERQGGAADV